MATSICGRAFRAIAAAGILVSAASAAAQEMSADPHPGAEAAYSRATLVQLFASALDSRAVAQGTAGGYWTGMSGHDQAEYAELLRQHLVALVRELLPDQVSVAGTEGDSRDLPGGDKLVSIALTINGSRMPVGIRLRGSAEPRIVDVLLSSVSLVAIKREEVGAVASRAGMVGVMRQLGSPGNSGTSEAQIAMR